MRKSTLFIVLLMTLFASAVFATPPMLDEIFLMDYEVSFVGESTIFEVEITVELLEDVDNGILWLENSDLGPVLANLREYYYFSGKAGERKRFVLKGEYEPESKNNCLYLEIEVLDDKFNPLLYNTRKSITIYLSSPSETTEDSLEYTQEYLRIEDLILGSKPIDPQKNKFFVDLRLTVKINIKGNIMPLKHVKVKLVEVDVVDNNVIAEGYTDGSGYIKLSGYAEDPLFDNPEVRWEIWSYVDPDEDNVAEVVVKGSSGWPYYCYSNEYPIDKDKQILETFTIQDNGSNHYNTYRLCHMISELHEKDKSAGLNLFLTSKEVVIDYPSGDWPCSRGYTIYLPENFFSSFSHRVHEVLAHEYAHCIDYHYNGYPKMSFSGNHSINTISDPGFALCEGWAEFYGYWLFGTENQKDSINKGNYSTGGPRYYDQWNGHSVEGSILALLWDVMDSDNEGNLDFYSLSPPSLEKTIHSSTNAITSFVKFVGGNSNDIRDPTVYGKLMTGNININWIWNLFAYYGIDNVATFLGGTVLSGGVPVPNAKVYMNDNGVWSDTVYTDSNGRFFFNYRPNGSIENVKVNDVVFSGFVVNPQPSPGILNWDWRQYTLSVAKHNLTVTTTPYTGLDLKIDGTTYTSPRILSVDKGTSHTIQVISPQEQDDTSKVSGTDMRYTFEKWTDGNTANPRTVTVNSDVTYTAQMKVECKVETATQPSGITTIVGSGWYIQNTNKTFTAPTVTGYTFSHWLVNGDNAGSSSSLSIKIDNPKKVVAVYENTSQNSGSLIIQGTANVSVQEFENGFLIWLRISGCNGMKAFELYLTATNSFTFEDIVFSSPNHIAGKKWSIVANNLQKKTVSVAAMSLDVAINGDQTLGYILCKTSTQILDWPVLSGTFNWSDIQDRAYSADLLIVHYATDFNRDNVVTVGDLGFFANRYNSKLGDPKWNPICDLSGDGKIDFDDLSYFVNHWKH